jgi:hypothetical protein
MLTHKATAALINAAKFRVRERPWGKALVARRH